MEDERVRAVMVQDRGDGGVRYGGAEGPERLAGMNSRGQGKVKSGSETAGSPVGPDGTSFSGVGNSDVVS